MQGTVPAIRPGWRAASAHDTAARATIRYARPAGARAWRARHSAQGAAAGWGAGRSGRAAGGARQRAGRRARRARSAAGAAGRGARGR